MTAAARRTDVLQTAANRLTTASLSDDEVRAIADAIYRSDNPLRFDEVRQAALMFERAGYRLSREVPISALALASEPIVAGSLVVDVLQRTTRLDGRVIELKHREFELLRILASHPGQVFLRSQLLDLVWPRDFEGGERTVDVHIARLRRKLGDLPASPALIVTVHGTGYKLVVQRAHRLD